MSTTIVDAPCDRLARNDRRLEDLERILEDRDGRTAVALGTLQPARLLRRRFRPPPLGLVFDIPFVLEVAFPELGGIEGLAIDRDESLVRLTRIR